MYADLIREGKAEKYYLRAFGIKSEEVPERVIVCPRPFSMVFPPDFRERLERMGEVEVLESRDYMVRHVEKNLLLRMEEGEVMFAFLGRGAVEFADKLFLLVHAPRVKELLFVGSGASLDPSVETEDLNVPPVALPLEDISPLLVDIRKTTPRADPDLHASVLELAGKTGVPVHSRLHATVPLFFMESREFLSYLKDVGVATVDMEIPIFFMISRDAGKRAAAVIRVGDRPLLGHHVLSEEYLELKKERKPRALEALFQIAVGFAQGNALSDQC